MAASGLGGPEVHKAAGAPGRAARRVVGDYHLVTEAQAESARCLMVRKLGEREHGEICTPLAVGAVDLVRCVQLPHILRGNMVEAGGWHRPELAIAIPELCRQGFGIEALFGLHVDAHVAQASCKASITRPIPGVAPPALWDARCQELHEACADGNTCASHCQRRRPLAGEEVPPQTWPHGNGEAHIMDIGWVAVGQHIPYQGGDIDISVVVDKKIPLRSRMSRMQPLHHRQCPQCAIMEQHLRLLWRRFVDDHFYVQVLTIGVTECNNVT
mmetsp:Transcript_114834/g.245152  ORF Transcript_114834/g.245152 Transcript_114834/m.245152 type:complete len:271 (-) Transcript_114834:316-1128(-)